MRVSKAQVALNLASVAVAMGWDRLIVAVAAITGVTVLGATGRVGSDAVVGIYSAVIGYVLGTGTSTARKNGS